MDYRTTWLGQAHTLGQEAGRVAGSWAADGNTDPAGVLDVLAMIEDGDPAVESYLPTAPTLSGEWADAMTPHRLWEAVTGYDRDEIRTPADGELLGALCEAWEEGVAETFEASCVATLRSFAPGGTA